VYWKCRQSLLTAVQAEWTEVQAAGTHRIKMLNCWDVSVVDQCSLCVVLVRKISGKSDITTLRGPSDPGLTIPEKCKRKVKIMVEARVGFVRVMVSVKAWG